MNRLVPVPDASHANSARREVESVARACGFGDEDIGPRRPGGGWNWPPTLRGMAAGGQLLVCARSRPAEQRA